ncbi:MAG: HIT domain-containing protein [Deltaproteobacteria bacterium]|nr:HIT domain-containing protein [Deltaproteobacteria bacterium]MBN2845260.1 HIT domain-containing protein [Deltaproteobacteria bacterium]
MDCLKSPGRMKYLKSSKPDGCIFCRESLRDQTLVLLEGKSCYVIMNKYPYNSGHLLIVPFRHVNTVEGMTMDEKVEMMELLDCSVKCLREALHPEGFNIGINIGKAGGAGVDDHLHMHIVPRWTGDTNFATVLGEVRVIPEDVEETRNMLSPFFDKNKEV